MSELYKYNSWPILTAKRVVTELIDRGYLGSLPSSMSAMLVGIIATTIVEEYLSTKETRTPEWRREVPDAAGDWLSLQRWGHYGNYVHCVQYMDDDSGLQIWWRSDESPDGDYISVTDPRLRHVLFYGPIPEPPENPDA